MLIPSSSIASRWMLRAVLLAASGCAGENNLSLAIVGNIVPDKQQDECSVETTGKLLFGGLYNVDSSRPYLMNVLYENLLRTSSSRLSSNTNTVVVERAEIELRGADGLPAVFGGLPNPFSITSVSTTVPSGTSSGGATTAGRAIGSLEIIPDAYRQQLPRSGSIIARVRAFGKTAGKIKVESGTFSFTIQLCGGNPADLAAIASGSVCLYSCADNADGSAQADLSCTPGQDTASVVLCP